MMNNMNLNDFASDNMKQKKAKKLKLLPNIKSKVFSNKSKKVKDLTYPVTEFLENGYVVSEYNGITQYQAIFRPTSYDLTKITDEEFDKLTRDYWEFHRLHKNEFKEIYLNFPESNKDNQDFVNEKMKSETDPIKQQYLNYEMKKLKVQEKWVKTRQSFIAVYGESIEDLEQNIDALVTAGKQLFTFDQLDKKEIKLLFELFNNSGQLSENTRIVKRKHADSDIIETATHGGLVFGTSFTYYQSSKGYHAIMYVSELPLTKKDFWISSIVNHEHVEVATVDYHINPNVDYEVEIGDTVENYNDEAAQARKRGKTTLSDAAIRNANELRILADKMNDVGEVIKTMEIRLFISAPTLQELEEKVANLNKEVKFEARIYPGMMLSDYQAFFLSHSLWATKFENNFREGIELPAETFGIGFAHNNSFLHDGEAFFYGSTQTGGRVYFDPFAKSKSRLSYSKFVAGSLGSGKSTLLKHMLEDNWMRGNFVYIFDKAGEFQKIVKRLGGAYLHLDGRDGLINLLQVFGLVSKADENNMEEDVDASFNSHLTDTVDRFNILYEFKTANANAKIRQILKEFYIDFGIYGTNATRPITQLSNKEYPTFLDFKHYLEKLFVQEQEPTRKAVEDDLISMITEVIEPNRKQFIGHTTLDNLLDNQLICFDISMINDNSTDPVYDTLFNVALSLFLSQAQNNGRQEWKDYVQGRKLWSEIKRTQIITDECHNVLNPYKSYATRAYSMTVAEGRKFFIDITLATQNVAKMLPPNAAQMGGEIGQAMNDISNIIGLVQYRMWMKQPPTAIPTLKKYFSDDFREFDYKDIKNYGIEENRGSKMMLVGATDKPLIMYHWVSPAELELFEGGA
ncbi:hypothetical protein LMK05_13155 (plasmid) [Lactococcus petauri]|nr:hypothetical protein LMK05_13155 [Lactococcus petauri]